MTEEGHKAAAAKERAEAAAERAKYDPGASTIREIGPAGPAGTEGVTMPGVLVTVNPTSRHLSAAEAHARHAKEHQAAAVALEKFQDQACATVPPADRVSCPLMFSDVRTSLPNGVRLYTGANRLQAVLAQIRCDLAFARAHGFEDPSLCPFAQKGVTAKASPDGSGIDLTTNDAQAIEALHSLVFEPFEGL